MKKVKLTLIASESKKEELVDHLQEIRKTFDVLESPTDKDFTQDTNVLLLGGDGSLNHLINHFQDEALSRMKVIYFPTGSANDFARSLGILPTPPSLDKIKSILNLDKTISIPLALCNDRKFINVMCAGAAALVTESGDTLLKKVMGKLTYYLGAIEQLLSTSTYKYDYVCRGVNRSVVSPGFVVSQGLYAGGGIKVSPSYSANFGETFDFVSLGTEKFGTIITSGIELQKEKPQLEDLELDVIKTNSIEVSSEENIPVKLDGEEYNSNQFKIQKSPTSLKFYLH